jgi:UDP-glucuronate decarboxylase
MTVASDKPTMNSERILVAGGAGFIGSHLCESLLADGYEVVCLDNFGSGRRENVAHLVENERFSLVEGDVTNVDDLPPVDGIYHLASRASPPDFEAYPLEVALANTEGTRRLLDHAVACDARTVYVSTSEVYGEPEVHPQTEEYNGNVNIRGPRACYDESKRFGETLTVAYRAEHGVDVRTARIFNTYGPRMRLDDGRVVPNFLRQALTGEPLTIHGDGEQTRSFCYVTDTVAGLRALMETDGLAGEVVNVGNTNEITILELAETVLDVVDGDSELVRRPRPEDDPSRRRPDTSKALALLGWEPTVSLAEGLSRTAETFRDQLDRDDLEVAAGEVRSSD